jgi:hypothetical protein
MSAEGDAPSKDAPSKDAPSTDALSRDARGPNAPSKDVPSKDAPSKPADVLFVHSPTPQGDGFRVLRLREDAVEVGEIRGVEEGRPIHGEVVKLTPREDHNQLFDVDVLVPGPKRLQGEARSGPPQVATDAYRENWRAIFGEPSEEPN